MEKVNSDQMHRIKKMLSLVVSEYFKIKIISSASGNSAKGCRIKDINKKWQLK